MLHHASYITCHCLYSFHNGTKVCCPATDAEVKITGTIDMSNNDDVILSVVNDRYRFSTDRQIL